MITHINASNYLIGHRAGPNEFGVQSAELQIERVKRAGFSRVFSRVSAVVFVGCGKSGQKNFYTVSRRRGLFNRKERKEHREDENPNLAFTTESLQTAKHG
jgi:hypothetical protein